MNTNQTPYTAAQIATVLAKTKRAVQACLDGIPPTSLIPAPGNPAKAWTFQAMPDRLRSELEATARERGFRSVAELLANPPRFWEPPIPLSQIQPRYLEEAEKRREAFAPALEAQHTTPAGELLAKGLVEFKRVFGYGISDDTWRRTFDRAIERDGGRREWQSLALYLDNRAFEKPAPAGLVAVSRVPSLKEPLDEILEEITNPSEPSDDDYAWLFHRTFIVYEAILADGELKASATELKQAIATEWLTRIPTLSKGHAGFVRAFERNLVDWREGDRRVEALKDRRPSGSGRKGYHCHPCAEKVNHQARQTQRHNTKGNVTEAFRRLWNEGLFCPACVNRFENQVRENPWFVPRCFRVDATPNKLELAVDIGPKRTRATGPYIPGDPSEAYAGRSFVFDDETPNHITFTHVNGELIIGHLQNIEGIDFDSDYPLGCNFYIGPPSCLEIFKAIYGVCTTVGIPDEEMLFEQGVFAARDIIGDREEERGWGEFSAGLNDAYGVRLHRPGVGAVGFTVKRATTPSAKPIEGYFGRTQRIASHLPGFRGFRARDEAPEWLDDFIARCKAGKEEPANELLSLDEFCKNYMAVREDFMRKPQRGMRLKGATPLEMWTERQQRKPIRQLDPNLAHILSTHRRVRPITPRGLILKISTYEKAVYYNKELGDWWGRGLREALVYRSIFDVNQVTVRHSDGRLLTVPRQSVSRSNATKEQLRDVNKHRRDFIAGATSRFSPVTHPLVNTILRDEPGNEAEKEVGRFHNQAQAASSAEESKEARAISSLRRRALEAGVSLSGVDLNNPRHRTGVEQLISAALHRSESTR